MERPVAVLKIWMLLSGLALSSSASERLKLTRVALIVCPANVSTLRPKCIRKLRRGGVRRSGMRGIGNKKQQNKRDQHTYTHTHIYNEKER